MTNPIARVYDETRGWGRGPADATELLAMCGLLRKDGA